jgi:hypothetical protein
VRGACPLVAVREVVQQPEELDADRGDLDVRGRVSVNASAAKFAQRAEQQCDEVGPTGSQQEQPGPWGPSSSASSGSASADQSRWSNMVDSAAAMPASAATRCATTLCRPPSSVQSTKRTST